MLAQIGLPELIIILMITVTWAIPIAFAVWVVVSLRRIRAGQQAADETRIHRATSSAIVIHRDEMLGYTFAALSFVLVAVALLVLKPRVPTRRERQPEEEYWSSVTGTILPMWFMMEAAGVIAVVGYFLTGLTVAAVAIAVSIGLFIWYGPKAFIQA